MYAKETVNKNKHGLKFTKNVTPYNHWFQAMRSSNVYLNNILIYN